MCQQITLLAKSNDSRLISCCEHGTFHLTWDYLTISFNQQGLTRLHRLIERASTLSPVVELRDGGFRVLRVSQCHDYQIRINQVGLKMSDLNLSILVELLAAALNNYQTRAAFETSPYTLMQQTVPLSVTIPFSRN